MNPSESITFFLIGLAVLLVVGIVWILFRKRKKWAIVLTCLLVAGYVWYYAYYPYLKVSVHAEKYEQVSEYLAITYPDRKFIVVPEQYEEGYTVGSFDVNDKETPGIGVTLYVDDNGQIQQPSNWTNQGFLSQRELWRELEFHYGENYTLDSDNIDITKQDVWIDGELTVFALTIDGMPAIAIYEYSNGDYGLLDLQVAEDKLFISAEAEGYTFIYVDERYEGETEAVLLGNGKTISMDAARYKGKLFMME
ncbi:LPXTG cell wall anchor domain-containing protein [Planococcus soli]|uniref:LPXTG cell wall anchor domain-containing protein n=1 Tax=Planococcus soli TaxID=2666072 RepID=UPI00115E5F52|nr:LPXTG cell wall anchor domain-containing protein [Planococcus soli]